MSNLRRGELLLASAISVALVGCMRIYPDPELPDIAVSWYDGDCRDGAGDVALSLTGLDDTTLHMDTRVACTAMKTSFPDVARQRFRISGQILDANGLVFSSADVEVDLRTGLDQDAWLYFGFDNFHATWTFDMGETCTSLGADSVLLELTSSMFPPFSFGAPCDASVVSGSAPDGVYTVTARAHAGPDTVALSPPMPDITIDSSTVTDLGTFVLSPCGTGCP